MVLSQAEVATEQVNLFAIAFDLFHSIMTFLSVQIGYRAGNGSSGQAAGCDGRGCETSDEEEEKETSSRPETNRTNEGNKHQRNGIHDQSKEYFGVAMDKMMAAQLSEASLVKERGEEEIKAKFAAEMEEVCVLLLLLLLIPVF